MPHLEGKMLVRERAERGRSGLPCAGAERKREGEGSGGRLGGAAMQRKGGGAQRGSAQRGGGWGVRAVDRVTPVVEADGGRDRGWMGH
jgi:hypothetical protein